MKKTILLISIIFLASCGGQGESIDLYDQDGNINVAGVYIVNIQKKGMFTVDVSFDSINFQQETMYITVCGQKINYILDYYQVERNKDSFLVQHEQISDYFVRFYIDGGDILIELNASEAFDFNCEGKGRKI